MEQFLAQLTRSERRALVAAVSSRIAQLADVAKKTSDPNLRIRVDVELHNIVKAAKKLGI